MYLRCGMTRGLQGLDWVGTYAKVVVGIDARNLPSQHILSCTSTSNISYPIPLPDIHAQSLDIFYPFFIVTLAILDICQPMRESTSNSD